MFEPSLADAINEAIDRSARSMGVALPGTIVSYNSLKQTCSVDPGVHRLVPSEQDADTDEAEQLPTVQNVPVIWPQGRNFKVVGTLQRGDPVLLVCLDRDPSAWLRTGQPAEPDDARTHHWSSAVAIPGLLPDHSPFPSQSDAAALASETAKLIADLRAKVNAVAAAVPVVPPPYTLPQLVAGPIEAQIASDVLKVTS